MVLVIPFFVRCPSRALRSSTHSTWCCSTRSTQCRTWRSSRFCRSPPSPPVLATSPLKQFTRWFDSGWYYDISIKYCSSVTVSMWWASSTCCSTLEGKRCVLFFSSKLCEMSCFLRLYCEFSLSDGELHRGWRNWRVRIIWERLRKWHLFLTFHGRAIPTKNNSRIDAIATYSSAITLVLFFGVSVLKIAKYGMNSE